MRLNKTTILLVEDNPDDADLLQEALSESPQFELVPSKRLGEALQRFDKEHFDIILLDLALPDSQGIHTLIRMVRQAPGVPIIVLTGTDDEALAIEALRLGAQDYLVKGQADSDLLARAIRYAMERQQTEDALLESEGRFRRIIENNADGIVIVDKDGVTRFVNPAAETLFGRKADELVGESFGFSIVAGESTELDITANGGKSTVVEMGVVEIEWDGEMTYLASLRDITERKRLEEQLRQAQKMEAVGRLAGGVAHDFNNLLTVIIGYSELLLARLDTGDSLRQDIQQIKTIVRRAASITRQLLAFSRRQVFQPQILDLNHIVVDMEKMLRRLIGEDIELVTILDPALKYVKADPGQIEQIIMNLVLNARDAMPHGGKLTIETGVVEIDETSVPTHADVMPGLYVMLSVSDTGIGMDEELQSQIFEPFFTTKEEGKGTGLGLATVYGIVKQSDGHIEVNSQPGRGTAVKIYLPRLEKTVEQFKRDQRPARPLRGSETILLVEDEESVRRLAQRILLGQGYTILEARHGHEALQVCERYQGPIHLLVTDVVMPGGMSGPGLAERLTSMNSGLKVIYVSGHTDEALIRYGVLNRDIHLLSKPFTPDSLARKVRQVLDA